MDIFWFYSVTTLVLLCSLGGRSLDNILANTISAFTSPFVILQKSVNCTKKPDLPCSITAEEFPCLPESVVPRNGWPGPPENFNVTITYVHHQNTCKGKVSFRWIIPNDNSALSLKGFQLEIFPLSSLYLGMQMCVKFDLSEANWTVTDITDQVSYNYSGTLLQHGDYIAEVSSLPKPEMGQIENKFRSLQFVVHKSYYDDGRCVLPITRTTKKPPHMSTPTASIHQHPKIQVTSSPSEGSFPDVPVAIGAGSGGAVILILILLVIIIHPIRHKRRYPVNTTPYDRLDDNHENEHPQAECPDPTLNFPQGHCVKTHKLHEPIPPSDITSNISEAVNIININCPQQM